MRCNVCESSDGHVRHCTGADLQTILDCMSGADGGGAYVTLRAFLGLCAKQGNDFPAVRQLASLIRRLSPGIDGE